jgi:hypothetical protein
MRLNIATGGNCHNVGAHKSLIESTRKSVRSSRSYTNRGSPGNRANLTRSEQKPATDALVHAFIPMICLSVEHNARPTIHEQFGNASAQLERMVLDNQTVNESERLASSLQYIELESLHIQLKEIDPVEFQSTHNLIDGPYFNSQAFLFGTGDPLGTKRAHLGEPVWNEKLGKPRNRTEGAVGRYDAALQIVSAQSLLEASITIRIRLEGVNARTSARLLYRIDATVSSNVKDNPAGPRHEVPQPIIFSRPVDLVKTEQFAGTEAQDLLDPLDAQHRISIYA